MVKKRQSSVLFLPFFYDPEFHAGIAQYAGEHGWHLNAEMSRTGKVPQGWRGDGIIMALTEDKVSERIARESRIPVVDISHYRADIPIPRVTKDNLAIGRLGARHFMEQGWPSFAFVSRDDHNVSRLRRDGFRKELEENGLSCYELIRTRRKRRQADTWGAQRKWLFEELVRLPRPLAVLAYNDYDAAVVLEACLEAGLRVPEDVGVLGVDDSAIVCPCQPVPLSSVKSEPRTVCYEAATLLDRLMAGAAAPPEPILIAPQGIARRQSTDRLVLRDPRLVRAVTQITQWLEQPFSMVQVADAAGISRKVLYQLFERELHQTPAEFILRRRMGLARKLLTASAEKEYLIARRCGMPVMSTFIRQFCREFGMTPRNWRRQMAGG